MMKILDEILMNVIMEINFRSQHAFGGEIFSINANSL